VPHLSSRTVELSFEVGLHDGLGQYSAPDKSKRNEFSTSPALAEDVAKKSSTRDSRVRHSRSHCRYGVLLSLASSETAILSVSPITAGIPESLTRPREVLG